MLAIDRSNEILRLVQEQGSVRVELLAARFNVSEMTIRRDLEKLERENLITRCHGGAVKNTDVVFDSGYKERDTLNLDVKTRLAGYCAKNLVHENMVVYLDAGSTILELAKRIISIPNITVITNDIVIAFNLINSDADLYLIGGKMQNKLGCIHGHIAESQLTNFRIDIAFVSSLTVDEKFDVFAATEAKVYFRRKLLEYARDTYMMIDSSKFFHQSLFKINNLSNYTAVITDLKLDGKRKNIAQEKGINFITVE